MRADHNLVRDLRSSATDRPARRRGGRDRARTRSPRHCRCNSARQSPRPASPPRRWPAANSGSSIAAGSGLDMSEAAPVAGRSCSRSAAGSVAAYVTEFYAGAPDSVDAAAFRYVVAADDGRVLDRRDLTISEKRKDPPAGPPTCRTSSIASTPRPANQRPLDGPQQNTSARIRPATPTARLPPFVRRRIW